jgi:acyl-CoA thioester hydrolase
VSHVQISELRVRYAETDQMGVVYHANYLVWCEIGRTDYLRDLGTSYAEIERSGITLVVSEATVRYHAAARYDDRILVRTTLAELHSRSIVFAYTVSNADSGASLVTARVALVSLNAQRRPATLPPDLRARLQTSR